MHANDPRHTHKIYTEVIYRNLSGSKNNGMATTVIRFQSARVIMWRTETLQTETLCKLLNYYAKDFFNKIRLN